MTMQQVAVVVVHHRSYATVAATVADLLEQGIPQHNIVLVDNSEQPERHAELESALPIGLTIQYAKNRGYGAAVNQAIDYFRAVDGFKPEVFVVATHETRPRVNAVRFLVDALRGDPAAAVAGPTLVASDETGEYVWSAGGYLSRVGHLPRHFSHRAKLTKALLSASPTRRSWLDGAFLAYRWSDIQAFRISEDYFLYMEETDLHLRLEASGRKALWVPNAVVWQSSGGVPPYYLARNLRLLFRRHEPLWRQLVVVPYAVGRGIAARVVREKTLSTLKPSVKGLLVRIPESRDDKSASIVILVNPLGGALNHYEQEISSVLQSGGASIVALSTIEPSQSSKSRLLWLWETAGLFFKARRIERRSPSARTLILWPALGYFDVFLARALRLRASVIIHDPHPLVRAIGYGRVARHLAAGVPSRRIGLIAHSEEAAAIIGSEAPRLPLETLPHPILPYSRRASRDTGALPLVSVLGQFKPDRDISAIVAIAEDLAASVSLHIHGRGWPNIPGWEVHSGFVPEQEMDELIASSSVVLIPYRRFYQSGVAMRCLENGTPVVGPRDSNLSDLLGKHSPLLVSNDPHDWARAVGSAIEEVESTTEARAMSWRKRALDEWKRWLENA